MRIVVVADVHANLAAFEAVLAEAGGEGSVDVVWSLGDLVGYGPEPSACIELLRSRPHVAIAGNHDLAAAGVIGVDDFNPFAAAAALWTAAHLSEADKEWIRGLPLTTVEGEFSLAHGSLRDPVWEYVVSPSIADAHLALQTTPYSFVGHTHLPAVFYESDPHGRLPDAGWMLDLDARRFVANPGGVGQPRDGDPRAAFAILDTEARRIQFRRVAYDIEATQAKILAAGLPSFLADRLAVGR